MAGDDDERSQRYTEDNRTAHLFAHSDKSVACVTNNKRLSTRRFLLLKLTIDRHEASKHRTASLRQLSYLLD